MDRTMRDLGAQDIKQEQLLRIDWDFALDYLNIGPDMTVAQFSWALKQLQHYGWDISADGLLETIKGM